MACTVAAITMQDCGNTPGLKKLYLALRSEIDTIPDPTNHVISSDITMVGVNVFKEIEFIADSGVLEEDGTSGEGIVQKTLTGFIPGGTATIKNAVNGMNGSLVVGIVEQTKDGFVLMGSKELPMTFKAKYSTQKIGGNERRGFEFTLTGFQEDFGFHYTGALPL
jgi:hypothetical protein